MSHRTVVVLVALAALVAGGCGDDAPEDPQVLRAGELDIRLPDGWRVTEQGAERPAGSGHPGGDGEVAAGPGGGGSSGTTIPLAAEDPNTKFFGATQKFRQCLEDKGTAFIGAPDASNPDSPTNDPGYIEDLSTCASKSGIVQAMQEMQAAQADQTPEEIEEQNKGYLRWRKCMRAKGWEIPEPTPDSEGRLFSFNTRGGGPQITPPPGKSLLGDSDMQQCAEESQR